MRKRLFVVIILLLTLLLLLSCSKNNTKIIDAEQPDVDIEDVDLEYEYIDLLSGHEFELSQVNTTSNGMFLLGDSNIIRNYLLIDEVGNPIDEITLPKEHSWGKYTLDSRDNIYIVREDKFKNRLVAIYDLNGNIIHESEEQKISDALEYTRKIIIDKQGLIYLLNTTGVVEVIDNNGNPREIIEVKEGQILDFDIYDNDNFIFLVEDDNNLQQIVSHNFKKSEQSIVSIKQNQDKRMDYLVSIKQDGNRNLLYGCSLDSVWNINLDGVLENELFPIRGNSVIESISNIFTIGDNYYIEGSFGGKKGLFRRQKIDEQQSLNKEIISIAINDLSTEAIKEFRESIMLFEKLNPDIKINIIEAGDLSYEQYLQTINTEIMLGKGPDVFLGKFPYDSYMEKGILLDFNQYMNKEMYYSNVLDAVKYKGKQLMFPLYFNRLNLYVNEGILNKENIKIDAGNWKFKDVEDLVEVICNKNDQDIYSGLGSYELYLLLENIIDTNIEQFIDLDRNEINFNSEEFRDLLISFKNIYDNSLQVSYSDEDRLFDIDHNGSYSLDTYPLKKMAKFKDVSIPRLLDNEKIVLFRSTLILCGVKVDTKNIDSAIRVVEYFASEGHGLKYDFGGIHINKNVLDWKRELYVNGEFEPTKELNNDFGLIKVSRKPTFLLEEFNEISELINSINDYNHNNIAQKIFPEIYSFFDDIQDLDTTINNIQNKVTLYIGE